MTTSRLRIIPKNDFNDAVLTVSRAETVGFEAANAQNTIRDKTLRVDGGSGWTLTGVWPVARTVSGVSMHRHNVHAANWRVRYYSDAAASVQVLDGTGGVVSALSYVAAEPYIWSEGSNDPFQSKSPTWAWHAAQSARSFKIDFSGTTGEDFWSISEIWMGRYMELAINPSFGMELAINDMTDRDRTQGGSLRTNLSETWRTLKFDLGLIDETEYASWIDIFDYAGTGRDVLVSAFPGDATRKEALHMIAGRFQNLNAIGRQVSWLTGRVQIEEN